MLFAQAGSADIAGLLQSVYLWRVLQFTLLQAGLSTLLSVGVGVAVARAFAREGDFPLRRALLGLMSLPIVLPSLVAVFGIVSIYGRNGWLAALLNIGGIEARPDIYGLGGVVLAHVFFNLPLAVRLLLPGWGSIPIETWRLADQLGMRGWARFRLIEAPMLRRYLPQAAAAIFMLCVGSFAIVLALGGGPSAATFEVAVFEAIRFEFDPPRAALLALCGLCSTSPASPWPSAPRERRRSALAGAPASMPGRGDGASAARSTGCFWPRRRSSCSVPSSRQ